MTEQERNLRVLKALGLVLLVGVAILWALLYTGHELPFYEMAYQETDATGYAPPPSTTAVLGGGVPRLVGVPPTRRVVLDPALPFRPAGRPVFTLPSSQRRPVGGAAAAITAGRKLYQVNCAMCHGKGGAGDGPVGQSYTPSPPDLSTYAPGRSTRTIYVVITYGILSTPVPTAAENLPVEWHSYRPLLSARERWEIALFVDQGLGSGG